jgi:TolA-binding protein
MNRVLPLSASLSLAIAAACLTPALAGESSDAAKAAYASAAALQNREAWELAAEEWASLVAGHPADPLALKARYYLAICQLKQDDWPAAEQTLRSVIASQADPDTRALARLELGRGMFRAAQAKKDKQAFASAAAALQEFLAASPKHAAAAEAAHLAGESLWQAGRRTDAIASWQAESHTAPWRAAQLL